MTTPAAAVDGSYAWMRLGACVLLGTIGNVGMWSVVVALPAVQAARHGPTVRDAVAAKALDQLSRSERTCR